MMSVRLGGSSRKLKDGVFKSFRSVDFSSKFKCKRAWQCMTVLDGLQSLMLARHE